MATAAPAAPPQASRSFAGLLEEYASPKKKFPPARDPGHDRLPLGESLDGFEDDVATLSYEHALKAHARYRREPDPEAEQNAATTPAGDAPPIARQEPQTLPHILAQTQSATAPRKCASVTLRLTAAEDDRMRNRAAEAGLTVSAYLRSCAFEVESLRAQVKEAIARMREAEQRPPARHRFWLLRFLRRSPDRA